jgi:predicted nucleic acid-binding protein
MSILIDSSVWIDYFRDGKKSEQLDFLIDENLIAVNDLILTELVPFLKVRNQMEIIKLLYSVKKFELSIDWDEISEFQYTCLKNGAYGIGIPDLIIVQNAKQNRGVIYSLDTHFQLMQGILDLQLLEVTSK